MRAFVLLLAALAIAYALDTEIEKYQSTLGWRADLEQPLPVWPHFDASLAIPESFDARKKWPNCKTIGTIYNQARCGSCWAVGGTTAASDRLCIATNGKFNQELSFATTNECGPAMGCDGGSLYAAWAQLQRGVPTIECYPYNQEFGGPIPTCAPQDQPPTFVATPNCWTNNTCVAGSKLERKNYTFKNPTSYDSVESMQQAIMTEGPIEACFSVYKDFIHYKSGVYKHDYWNFGYLGGHCVRIIGWGVENGEKYWEVANSWTTTWGNKGYFRIARGVNECGIESNAGAGVPNL